MIVPYLIRRAARQYASEPAVACRGNVYSFAQVYERACRLANVLIAAGCSPGDRIGVYVPNRAECMEIEFGIALAGLVRVSLNVRLAVADQRFVLEDARARALVYSGEYSNQVSELSGTIPGLDQILGMAKGDGPGRDYESALVAAATADPGIDREAEDLCTLFYTSGTSGRPKGVMLSHRAQVAVALGLLLEFRVRRGEKILLLQPLSHGAGFFMLPYFISGAQCVILPKFDPDETLAVAAEAEVDTIKLVPTMLGQLLEVAPRRLPAVTRIIYGAAPMPAQWLQAGMERFGGVFAQLYGQAEAPMCITVLPEEDHDLSRPGLLSSVGRPWRNATVRVVAEDGREARPGETGEVVVSADTVMTGYWDKPDETAKVLVGGVLHTRDLATTDDRGYIYLLGRSDDMINSGGFMVAPRTVEEVLHQHPAIQEAAVIGVPDQAWGEAVKAVIVLRSGWTLTAEQVFEFCRERLSYQRPRYVDFRSELPKNAYGKVLKTQLRAENGRLAGDRL